MDDTVRQYLTEIGRRGGARSRRSLAPETARRMVEVREARRAAGEFARSHFAITEPALPGVELIIAGLQDLAESCVTTEALLVSIAAPRLRLLGIRVPTVLESPEARLFANLDSQHGDGAHSRYNALIRRLVSFARSAGACLAHPETAELEDATSEARERKHA